MRPLALLALLTFTCASGQAVEQGQQAPPFNGTDFSGNEVSFPSVSDGKPSVMVFWATWCPYCKTFMPYPRQIQRDYGEDEINIVAINAKERGEGNPKACVEELG